MVDKDIDNLTNEEKILREKARQIMKKNKTPAYAPNDDGGLLAGPLNKEEMEKQVTDDDE